MKDEPKTIRHMNIILVGFMGTGKSAVGKRLADKLQVRFIDMDKILEARAGKPINRIFTEDGEARFRTMERELARELSQEQHLVIATGGGIVLNPDNISDFSQSGLVVCLSATPDEILRRVKNSTHRPLLNQPDPAAAIRNLLAKRQPLYDAIPCQVDTTGKTAGAVAQEVLDKIQNSKTQIPNSAAKQKNSK